MQKPPMKTASPRSSKSWQPEFSIAQLIRQVANLRTAPPIMRQTAGTRIGEIREVLGIYRAELRNIGVMLQVYDNQSKAAFVEKLTLSPLFAIPVYLTMVLGRE